MISIFYLRHLNINPSYNVLFNALQKFVSPDLRILNVNDLTVDQIKRYASDSALLVVDNSLFMGKAYQRNSLSTVFIPNWKGQYFYEEVLEMLLEQAAVPRLYVASGWDLHWPGPEIERILARIDALAWMFEKRPVVLEEVQPQYRDSWMQRHDDPLENWHAVRHTVATRIELIHSLAFDEFYVPPKGKVWDVCIAGVRYSTRQIARQEVSRTDLCVAPYAKADAAATYTMRFLSRFVKPAAASQGWIRWRHQNQRILSSRSRMNFVCGSGLLYPVRKFFEIPAYQSVMVAMPCLGFNDYGFVDGINSVATAPEDAGRCLQDLKKNPRLQEQLRTRAFEVVQRLHTAEQRAQHLIECARRLLTGTLKGAQFVEGQFEIY